MKHSMLIIVLLCLSLVVCACSNSNNIGSGPIDQNNQITNNEQNGDIEASQGGDRPMLSIESVGEYTDFIKSTKLPENFVTYEKINQLGDFKFKFLVFLEEVHAIEYKSYLYTLVDSSGYEICLYIDNLETVETDDINISTDTVNAADMRTIAEKTSGTFTTDGISYKYVAGELLSISWIDQGIRYKLCGDPMLSDYPATQSTFVGKLLNANVASSVVGKIFATESK